jgi:hypothetical protein
MLNIKFKTHLDEGFSQLSSSEDLISLERKLQKMCKIYSVPVPMKHLLIMQMTSLILYPCSKKPHSGRVYDHQAMEKTGVDQLSADLADGWSTSV